jgi:hypothetical protein
MLRVRSRRALLKRALADGNSAQIQRQIASSPGHFRNLHFADYGFGQLGNPKRQPVPSARHVLDTVGTPGTECDGKREETRRGGHSLEPVIEAVPLDALFAADKHDLPCELATAPSKLDSRGLTRRSLGTLLSPSTSKPKGGTLWKISCSVGS